MGKKVSNAEYWIEGMDELIRTIKALGESGL